MCRWRLDFGAALRWSALGAVLLAGCQRQNQFVPPPPPKVTVAQPVQREVQDYMEFTGTTRATATVEIRARVNGYLERIAFEDGQEVKQGDLLFVIEQAPFRAALAAAEAGLQKARANLQLAQADLARTTELFQKSVVTEQEMDTRKAQVAIDEANVAAAQAAVDQAKLDFGYTEIRAPISGRIGQHLVDVGNLIRSGESRMTVIESHDPIHVYFNVSERDLLRFLQTSGKVKTGAPDAQLSQLSLGLPGEDGFPHQGQVDFRELGVDPGTGTIMRRGIFPNADGRLVPGMFVRVRTPIGPPQRRLVVAERAVGSDQRGDYLLVVDQENTVEYRPVKLGLLVDGQRVVKEGVQEGDWVVVDGLQRARPGAKVDPTRREAISGIAVGATRGSEAVAAAIPAGKQDR